MENPFVFGKIVKGKNFFDRDKERAEIKNLILNHQNLILYSPRRYGKTSLILKVFDELKNLDKKFCGIYIDFYRVNSINDFITQIVSEYSKTTSNSFEKLLSSIKQLMRSVSPSISLDDNGAPKLNLSISPKEIDYAFEDAINLPNKLAEKECGTVAVFFDEFQEVANLNGSNFIRRFRSHIQHHNKISYIFCGSKRHLLENIFNDPNNPLFKIGVSRTLQPIPRNIYVNYIKKNFKKIRKDFNVHHAKIIYDLSAPSPYNIQYFCHHLFNACLINENEEIESLINQTMSEILANKDGEFMAIYDFLTVTSRKVLKAIIKTNGKNLFRKEILRELDIPLSTLKKTLDSLVKKNILMKNDEEYEFSDIFFKKWLIEKFDI